jgi:hypothetical protein
MAASTETLMRQAPQTAEVYLREVVRSINAQFGDGYALQHPELVAAMLQTCALDFSSCMISNSLGQVADAIHSGLSGLS